MALDTPCGPSLSGALVRPTIVCRDFYERLGFFLAGAEFQTAPGPDHGSMVSRLLFPAASLPWAFYVPGRRYVNLAVPPLHDLEVRNA